MVHLANSFEEGSIPSVAVTMSFLRGHIAQIHINEVRTITFLPSKATVLPSIIIFLVKPLLCFIISMQLEEGF